MLQFIYLVVQDGFYKNGYLSILIFSIIVIVVVVVVQSSFNLVLVGCGGKHLSSLNKKKGCQMMPDSLKGYQMFEHFTCRCSFLDLVQILIQRLKMTKSK